MNELVSGPNVGVTVDEAGESAHTKDEELSDAADSDPRSETDSGGGDQQLARRRQLSTSSITAHTIVNIQRRLHFAVDRVKQHHGNVSDSIQELESITKILETMLGENIQPSEHREQDKTITISLIMGVNFQCPHTNTVHIHTLNTMFQLK